LLYKIEQYHMASSDLALLPPGEGRRSTATDSAVTATQNWRR
jgi:hypothetical protein